MSYNPSHKNRMVLLSTYNSRLALSTWLRPVRHARSKTQGFTLIELMIVTAILSILAAIAIPAFSKMALRAREAATKGNLGALRAAVSIAYGANEGFPYRLSGNPPADFLYEGNGFAD